jgi:Co/Zn/Cd efflux system component
MGLELANVLAIVAAAVAAVVLLGIFLTICWEAIRDPNK